MILIEKAKGHLKQQLPFVLFRYPNQNLLKAYFQLENTLFPFEEQSGFVFQSFNHDKSCCLPLDKSIYTEEIIFTNESHLNPNTDDILIDENAKNQFENLVSSAINEINKTAFEKVVLSRKIELELKADREILTIFKNALNLYPSAFVYIFYHPKVGLWLGATPELLLSIKDENFETVSLAGTRLNGINTDWTKKETKEQEIVTSFISSILKPFTSSINLSTTETIRAGHLDHLITNISGKLKTNTSIVALIKGLHPTPAVCGLPRQHALDFIYKYENYDREFYAGFLGEHLHNETKLYVNLRCMQLINNQLKLYAGCGITAESDPEKEFFETENKTRVMRKLL
jgi:isochorismate synthase